MSTTSCTRCGRTLPPTVVRELARGTRCPFCAAILERPKPKSETPLYGTPATKHPAFATTMPGRARLFEAGNASAAASPEAKAWLNALLRPSAMASPLAAAASAAASPPAVEPPVVAPAPAFEPPVVAPEPAFEPPADPPAAAAAAPVVELAADKRPTVPMAAVVDLPETEAEPPPSPVAARSVEPPPLPAEALEEAPDEPGPELKAEEPPPPPPRAVAAAAPRASMILDDSEALLMPVGNRRPRVLVAVGAVVLGGVLALILRGAQPEAQPAPVAATPPAEPTAPPAPAAAPVEPPKPAVELALDPTGGAKASAPPAEAAPAPPAVVDETPRARRRRSSSDEETPAADPDDAASLRQQGLEYEKQGKVEEALAAYREYLSRATRTRDRVAIARRMYDLTHPGE